MSTVGLGLKYSTTHLKKINRYCI